MQRKEYDSYRVVRDQKGEALKKARVQFAPLQKKLDSMANKKKEADASMKATVCTHNSVWCVHLSVLLLVHRTIMTMMISVFYY